MGRLMLRVLSFLTRDVGLIANLKKEVTSE